MSIYENARSRYPRRLVGYPVLPVMAPMNPVLHELLARVTSVRHSASSSSLESSSNHNDDGTTGRVRGYLVTSYSPVQRKEPDYKAWT
jgi:hypothetical protein